jgi:NAD(P)-dependent dehydrogenase (short-subunit alcohol dehydrogenase family)
MAPKTGVAVVTGGGGGIGAECVRLLAEEGLTVVVLDIDGDRARDVAASVGGVGFAADVADADAIEALAARIEAEIGPVSALVTCAGMITRPCRAQEEMQDHWDLIMAVNLRGVYVSCVAFAKAMLERRKGSIVTIGSLAGMGVLPVNSYGTSKAGVIHLSQSLAADWGRRNVRVNCVSPGPVRTPAIEASYARGDRDPKRMESQTALGRLVRPREVAEAVCFLLSDRASAISGINLPVDAGVWATLLSNLFGAPEDVFP